MSFNIKNSFVSRSIVEDDKEKQLDPDAKEEVVIQETYDPRTLYERLQEQKNLKEEKFAEESRLSNHIKRVDEEEAEYFRTLSDEKEKLEYQRKIKEQLELEEYRQAVESVRSNPVGQIPTLLDVTSNATTSTTTTIASKTKPVTLKTIDKKSKNALKGALILKKKKRGSDDEQDEPSEKKLKTDDNKNKLAISTNKVTGSLGLLSNYDDISSSSSSDSSSDTENVS